MECDGVILDLPEDIEGLLLLNINSYMGGVDLWASGASYSGQSAAAKQSFCDGRLEVLIKTALPSAHRIAIQYPAIARGAVLKHSSCILAQTIP